MQVTETLSDGLRRAYSVIVSAAEIEGRRSARLEDLGKSVRLPGFRPGKVPRQVITQRFGAAIDAEVLEQSVDEATRQVLTDRGLRPALQPKVDLVKNTPTEDLQFNVELEILPDITVPDLRDIPLIRLTADVAPEAIDAALGELARRNREFEPVTETRPAEAGEVLTVDYEGRVDGVAFEGGRATGSDVEVAGPGFIPGFTEQLVGLSPGEDRTITVTFPADYGTAELAGKEATFDVSAKALKRGKPVTLDDAFAETLGFETLDQVRDLLARQIGREYVQLSRLRLKRDLLDALAERAAFAAPAGLVEAEFEQIWRRVDADLKAGKLDADDAGKDEATLRSDYRGIADRRVRLGLLLAEIGRANGISVQDQEMTLAMRAEASRYPGQEAQIMEFFRKNPQAAETLRGPIYEDKVVDFVIDAAAVTDRPVSIDALRAAANGGTLPPAAAAAGEPEAAPEATSAATPTSEATLEATAGTTPDAPAGAA